MARRLRCRTRNSRIVRFAAVLTISVVIAGCVGAPPSHRADTTSTPSMTTSPKSHPDLASPLYQLATADDPQSFAREHNMSVRNGSVKALVELKSGRELPEGYGLSVVTSHENRVLAWVPIDQLVPLADHENVSFVRQPVEPQTFDINS